MHIRTQHESQSNGCARHTVCDVSKKAPRNAGGWLLAEGQRFM